MPSLNDPANFAGRVNYAAAVIANGRNQTRSFDNCFENYDGDAVTVALMRRAQKNPRLRDNLPRYLCVKNASEVYERHKDADLPALARAMRIRAGWEAYLFFAKQLTAKDLCALAGINGAADIGAQTIDDLKGAVVARKTADGELPPGSR